MVLDFSCVGHFLLPVGCLKAPPNEWLVRDCSEKVVEQLKIEMIANNCSDVQPILCIVDLNGDELYDLNSKEGYHYCTIGGNHSRQALQELLKENPTFVSNKEYTHRLCAVYKPMDTKLIRRLASKHNRAAAFCHEMNTWDWVSISHVCSLYGTLISFITYFNYLKQYLRTYIGTASCPFHSLN